MSNVAVNEAVIGMFETNPKRLESFLTQVEPYSLSKTLFNVLYLTQNPDLIETIFVYLGDRKPVLNNRGGLLVNCLFHKPVVPEKVAELVFELEQPYWWGSFNVITWLNTRLPLVLNNEVMNNPDLLEKFYFKYQNQEFIRHPALPEKVLQHMAWKEYKNFTTPVRNEKMEFLKSFLAQPNITVDVLAPIRSDEIEDLFLEYGAKKAQQVVLPVWLSKYFVDEEIERVSNIPVDWMVETYNQFRN